MARLTNRQMEVLAARVTDLLEEATEVESRETRLSDEYINFEKNFNDETVKALSVIAEKLEDLKAKKKSLEYQIDQLNDETRAIKEEIQGSKLNSWYHPDAKDVLRDYIQEKKDKAFANTIFNREKTLRRVEADILLSDIANPEELVKSLVEKLKQ